MTSIYVCVWTCPPPDDVCYSVVVVIVLRICSFSLVFSLLSREGALGYNINIEVCIYMHKSKRNVVSPRDSIRIDFGSLDVPGINQLLPQEELEKLKL